MVYVAILILYKSNNYMKMTNDALIHYSYLFLHNFILFCSKLNDTLLKKMTLYHLYFSFCLIIPIFESLTKYIRYSFFGFLLFFFYIFSISFIKYIFKHFCLPLYVLVYCCVDCILVNLAITFTK